MGKNKEPGFTLGFEDGSEYDCTRKNASLFLHLGEVALQKYDHIFIHLTDNPDDEERGLFTFREQLANFDDIADYMIAEDFAVLENTEVNDHDREVYEQWQAVRAQKHVDQPVIPITPRQQKHLDFFRYLLDNDRLDFNVEGDIPL